MKRSIVLLLAAFLAIPYLAGAQYLNTTWQSVATPGDTYAGGWCDPNTTRSLTFDLESISGGTMLDLAIAKTVKEGIGWPGYYGFQDYNSGSGGFPNQNGNFFYNYSTCADNDRIYNFVYGKLRTSVPRKDLAVLRQTGTYIYYNTGNGMATSPNQTLSGLAKDATWGTFNYQDDYDDLAVTDGNQIKIYNNLNDGTVSTSPTTFSIPSGRIVLAQMNKNIFLPNQGNQWDLVSINGNTVSIRLNNGANGFNGPQDINMGSAVYSFAIGDVNNDKFNDVVVARYDEVRLYLNNGSGALNTTATWTLTGGGYIPGNPQVMIGDLGAPGDATRNDGWNDILVTGYETLVSIFINQGSGSYFTSSPQQSFYSGNFYTAQSKAMLADIQNTGGLSLVWGDFISVYTNSHTGNPAPAPPKNLTWSGAPGQHPTFTWSPNTERDMSGYNIFRDGQKLNSTPIVGTT